MTLIESVYARFCSAAAASRFGIGGQRTVSVVLLGLLTVVGLGLNAPESVEAAPTPTPDLPKELRLANYTLVAFYTTWCPVCQEMEPYLENLKAEGCTDLKIVKIDVDKEVNHKYAELYEVEGVPTYILFDKKGKAVYKMDRLISPTVLRRNVTKVLGENPKTAKACY